ncbi:MAG: SMC-Scp complex subunit ScpB [Candidatus Moraniibacteriota bacterium]
MKTESAISIQSKIESLLFLHGEPISVARLSKALSASEAEIEVGLEDLAQRYVLPESGLTLIRNGKNAELATRAENAPDVEAMLVSDREETLGKATMETLSVVAYRGPVSRASIDAIRGVNSSFALRSLLLRGLIDRRPNPFDAREFEYTPSFRLFELLGIGSNGELPEYATLSRDPRLAAREEHSDATDADVPEEDVPEDARTEE